MRRGKDLHLWQCRFDRGQNSPLPLWMQVSINLVKHQQGWKVLSIRVRIHAHKIICQPTDNITNSIRYLRKIELLTVDLESGLERRLDVDVKLNVLAAHQSKRLLKLL